MARALVTGGSEPSVVVVGGGVIGVSSAYYLARRGARVVLLDRDEIGRGASFGNAGLISPGHPPINKPGRVRQGLRYLTDPLSPLYVEPRWDPALARWLWSFSRHCTHDHLERSMTVLAALGQATDRLFDELMTDERLSCGHRRTGYLEVYNTEEGLAEGRKEAALIGRHGIETEALSGGALREREPVLSESVEGGWLHPEGSVISPYRFVLEMAERAERHGVVIRPETEVTEVACEGTRVRGVRTVAGELVEAQAVVLATGAYSLQLAAKLGCPLPIQPAKGYHCDRDPERPGTPALGMPCLLGERSIFCSPMDDFVRFAGTLELSGENDRIRQPRLEQLTRGAAGYMNGVADAEPLSEWCGLRPCLPDGLPAIGAIPGTTGAFVATGHAMLGLTLGPITGKLVSELVMDGSPSIDVGALGVERFLH